MVHSCATSQASTLNLDGHVHRNNIHAAGHDPTGAIVVTTDYHHMMKWALSFALCGEVSQSVRSLSNTEQDIQHTRHKEEDEDRIKTD